MRNFHGLIALDLRVTFFFEHVFRVHQKNVMKLLSKKLRHVATLFALGSTVVLSSCESPLSDVEITDPGLLQTHFVVERALLQDGSVIASLNTTILDKNLASVELKNAHVKVNGEEMSTTELLNITTYYIPSASVNLNTAYNFEVILSDGQSYGGSVTTPGKTFTSVSVPSNPGINEDLTVSWDDVHVYEGLTISLNLTSPAGTVPGATFTLTEAQMEQGSFVIPKSNFATPAGITSIMITLTGFDYGTINSGFRSGSATISRMRAEKKVTFN